MPRTARQVVVGAVFLGLVVAWLLAARALWDTSVPADLAEPDLDASLYFDPADIERAADYNEFLRIDAVLASVAQLVALGLFALRGERFARESAAGRIGTGMLLGMLGLAVAWLATFPFGLAAHWWQRRYETAREDYFEWAVNSFLAVGGEFLFISLALLVVMAAAALFPRRWWAVAVPPLLVVGLGFAFLQPYLVPNLDELDDPALERDATRLAAAAGVPGTPVRVQEVRELTTAPNAEAAGIGASERVIVWDTLLQISPRPEVRVVLAHEFAHLARDHVWKLWAWGALLAMPIALCVALATRRRGGIYNPAAVPVALFVVVAVSLALSPAQREFTQRLEAEADWLALETSRDPAAAEALFRRFTRRALAEPRSPGWAEALLETHPSVMDRIEMVAAWRAREGGGATAP